MKSQNPKSDTQVFPTHAYIFYEKDGFGGSEVDKIFWNEDQAIEYAKEKYPKNDPTDMYVTLRVG